MCYICGDDRFLNFWRWPVLLHLDRGEHFLYSLTEALIVLKWIKLMALHVR